MLGYRYGDVLPVRYIFLAVVFAQGMFSWVFRKNLVWLIFSKKSSKNGCYFAPNPLFRYSFKIGSLDFSVIMHEVTGVTSV